MKRFLTMLIFAAFATSLLAACGPASSPDDSVEHNVDEPQQPAEQDDTMPPVGAVYSNVTVGNADVLIMESYPIQVAVNVSGTKATPCEHIRVRVAPPDENNQIHINLDSWANPDLDCIQVLAEFEQRISLPLEDVADGDYTVWVNGEQVGAFTYPGG
ncbi:MAG: hypothetical protein JXB38_14735 [Anaerolineales bacterium]|nr:hypothetical protein [Anaerolineales bacterium]